jgi:membrane-associated phospholipid phosphatase
MTPPQRLLIVSLACIFAFPCLSQAQPETSRVRFVHWMYQDLGGLAEVTFTPRTGLYVAGGAALTAGLSVVDDELQDGVHDVYTGGLKSFVDAVEDLGGPRINLPVVLIAGGSMFTRSTKLQDAAFTSFQTLVYAGLLGYAFKGIFGRRRPELTDNPYAFFATTGKNPFSGEGNSSYPSGHAIASFGIITPWVVYYPSILTYGLYILPVGTSLARLAHDKHWTSDIVVGAAIGIAMGRWLARRHQRLQSGPNALVFSLAPGYAGIRYRW